MGQALAAAVMCRQSSVLRMYVCSTTILIKLFVTKNPCLCTPFGFHVPFISWLVDIIPFIVALLFNAVRS